MNTLDPSELLASLLGPPDPRGRADFALRALGTVGRAATADELWWRHHGGLSAQESRRVRAAFALAATILVERAPRALVNPRDVARCVASLSIAAREELWVITVDAGLRRLSSARVAVGGRSSCSADPTEVLRIAVVDQADGLFMVHNHPNGDPVASEADTRFTSEVRRGAIALCLRLHDHIVIGGDRWASELTGTHGRLGHVGPEPSPTA